MGNGKELDEVTQRLDTALKAMEDAVASKRHSDLTVESLEERIESLQTSLDEARQRHEKVAAVNDDVSQRIDTVMASINDMLKGD